MACAYPASVPLLLTCGLFALTGCTAESPPEVSASPTGFDINVAWVPERPITLPAMTDQQKMEFRDQWLDGLWRQAIEQYPDLGERPEVSLESFGTPQSSSQQLADCFTEAGYPAIASAQGGVEYPGGVQSSPQYELVNYTCYAKFLPDPLMLRDWNADQLGLLYDYRVEWFIPCLESFGLSPEAGPDRETFINDFYALDSAARNWWPEETAVFAGKGDEVLRACPPIPVDYFYGG